MLIIINQCSTSPHPPKLGKPLKCLGTCLKNLCYITSAAHKLSIFSTNQSYIGGHDPSSQCHNYSPFGGRKFSPGIYWLHVYSYLYVYISVLVYMYAYMRVVCKVPGLNFFFPGNHTKQWRGTKPWVVVTIPECTMHYTTLELNACLHALAHFNMDKKT